MSFGVLLQHLTLPQKGVIRDKEKLQYKLNNATVAVDFLTACIQHGLLPKFTYSRQATSRRTLPQERMSFLKEELQEKESLLQQLLTDYQTACSCWNEQDIPPDIRAPINTALECMSAQHILKARQRIGRKLAYLYGGPINIPRPTDRFVNLSCAVLSKSQTEFLNLGLNCHYMTRPHQLSKKIELEMLLDNIHQLERDKKVTTNPNLPSELCAEANKRRGQHKTALLTPELRQAANELRELENISIRRADKSSVYVLLDKEDYLNKMKSILDDPCKFKTITSNPTNELRTRLNRIIRRNNSIAGASKLPLIEGDHKLGYAFGNVKTHKQGNPLRPIISQTPTATYKLAKRLNSIITPYIPSAHSLKSSKEFLDILEASHPSGILASLDVESLFTNVPVNDTINMICQRIYHSPEITPLTIPEDIIRELLEACTKEAPFYGPDGKMRVQIDGVAMGSPLGPLFANFYMGSIEEKIFKEHPTMQPHIYVRYVDDIFINAIDTQHVTDLVQLFSNNSSLNYTSELEKDGTLPFLDVLVGTSSNRFTTEVYVKDTNLGFCLSGKSECPDRYKRSVVQALVNRAFTHCSTWTATNTELQRVTTLLVNNGYPQQAIDSIIKKKMDSLAFHPSPDDDRAPTIDLFYKGSMNTGHKEDEKALRTIISRNVLPTNPETKVRLIIYYKTSKTHTLVMKNNCLPPTPALQEVNVVYRYDCPVGECQHRNSTYVGMTSMTLSKRLSYHLQNGAIKRHTENTHNISLTRTSLNNNTKIVFKDNDIYRLRMAEAVTICLDKPAINIQLMPVTTLPSSRKNPSTAPNPRP